ncbi:J domain-containing protein 1 [Candidozyma auris]|uniref:J domain-containing protein n=1 Tax=Candidozyma auris TaxID=498019 RepID=A0A8F2VX82_CANAR|nr:hypothetical_protein [[Candida] auris]KNE02079.2 hypothetical protein QG37_00759 [[Candida] auris]PIS54211.1 hypothetical protein CJI97_003912 [[Candida] auris]PSK77548.1 hypothetical protein CJJ07_002649 [[Candida] auris]QEL58236.1 hypothetical protein CJJ09_000269 [[Candida] auris]QEO21523.1 hypothetical_protein [[Candida] auris]
MLLCIRRYATEAKRQVNHSHFDLHAWPKSKRPSPHDIFDMDPSESAYKTRREYDSKLKSTYKKLIKMYHPDLAVSHDIVEGSTTLSASKKRARFDEIQKAYEVLKDPRKRIAYKKYEQTTWDDYKPGKTSSFEAYRMANAHRRQYSYENDPKFWHAATWEDYYQMKWGRSPPTAEELEKNKWKILYKVLIVASVAVVLQVMLAIERTDEFNRQTRLMNLRADADLRDSYNNFDEGRSQFQRMRRFLLYRRSGLDGRDDEATKKEENDILTRFAQQQVDKFK